MPVKTVLKSLSLVIVWAWPASQNKLRVWEVSTFDQNMITAVGSGVVLKVGTKK